MTKYTLLNRKKHVKYDSKRLKILRFRKFKDNTIKIENEYIDTFFDSFR